MLFGTNKGIGIVALSIALTAVLFGIVLVFAGLLPADGDGAEQQFTVSAGEGAREIIARLEAGGLIRSRLSFVLFGALSGALNELKPGKYELAPSQSSLVILTMLREGPDREIAVTIPEGATAREIDATLAGRGVTAPGTIVKIANERTLEGKLFPDTYRFFVPTDPEEVVERLLDVYEEKAMPVLRSASEDVYENLILASLIEKEVPDSRERRIVAGILKKRLKAGMPLQADAAFCYTKAPPCHPITASDLTTDSPYNTYIYKGLPPTPIGNPGEDALRAAVRPIDSLYWYYLSDPETKRTVFASTLDEHRQNRVNYLNQ